MKVKHIEIQNFRSAEEFSLNFNENFNVLVGINGAGKTTILDAISISLSWLVNRIQRPNSSGAYISDSDIRYDCPYSSIKLDVNEFEDVFSWQIVKGARGFNIDEKSELSGATLLASLYQDRLTKDEKLPVIAYYPVSRVVDRIIPEIRTKDSLYVLDVYDNALSGKRNYQSFFEWFRIQDDIINEKANSRTKWTRLNQNWIKRRINRILKALEGLTDKQKDKFIQEEFSYLGKRLLKDELTYEEPRYLFHELSRLVDLLSSESNSSFRHIFRDLEYMFHKMEMYSKEYRDDLIDRGGRYEETIFRVLKDFERAFIESNTDFEFISIIWDIFTFANVLSLWWVSEKGRRNIEQEFKSLQSKFNTDKSEWSSLAKNLIDSLNLILEREIKQQRKAFRSEGKELKTVAKAIEQFIPEYSMLRVKRTPRPHMLINKGKAEYNLNQLSDGEKNLITLVGDIARRLSIANPHSKEPLNGEGIILIDEVDLHLHPSWQRLMIPRLTKVFPNCQFIISTHSPQVLSHVQPESLFLLDNKNNNLSYSKATESYGKNTDRILEDILGVDARPSSEKKRIQNLFKMIEEGRLDEAKNEIDDLSKIIIGGEPELSKARVLIKRKEIIGK